MDEIRKWRAAGKRDEIWQDEGEAMTKR